MFSPQPQIPLKTYPAAVSRWFGSVPLGSTCENVCVSSIVWLWSCAESIRNGLIASGCLASAVIVPAASPSLREVPYAVASAVGLAQARLISSTSYCSSAVGKATDNIRRSSSRSTEAAAASPTRAARMSRWV